MICLRGLGLRFTVITSDNRNLRSQHYQKLRLEYTNANGKQHGSTEGASKATAGKAGNNAEQSDEASSAKATPRKRTKKAASKIKMEERDSDDGDHELSSASPKKKAKNEH
jgi:hypothetical protein